MMLRKETEYVTVHSGVPTGKLSVCQRIAAN